MQFLCHCWEGRLDRPTGGERARGRKEREREEKGYYSQLKHAEIEVVIQKLKIKKAAGPDGICPWMIKHGGEALSRSLLIIFQTCCEQESIPNAWREARIQPLMKHNASRRADELRPISLLSVVSKAYDSAVLTRSQSAMNGYRTTRRASENTGQQ